jgi:outer membrane protein assembly factor BamB
MYKMAILDHSGELKTEREFPRNKYYPANIKMSNGRIFLLLSNTTRAGSLLVCFDLDLNIVWQRETPKGLIGNEFSLSKTANTILVNTQDEVACWNTSSGIDLWRVPTSEFEGVGDRMITSQFVIEDSYAAVLIGKYIASMGFTNNMLIVLNADNGQRLFSDTLPDTQTFAEILTAGNRFLLSADQQILVYEK